MQQTNNNIFRLEPIYKTFIYRLLIVYVLFTLSRISFYAYNHSYFENTTFTGFLYILLGGLKFDTVAILYTNILFFLLHILPLQLRYNNYYQSFLKYLFFITNSIVLAANYMDTAYFPYTLKRTTATVFGQFANEQNMGGLFLRFLWDFKLLLLLFVLSVVVMIYLYKKIKLNTNYKENVWSYHLKAILLMAACSGLFVAGVRGGFLHSTRPITLSNAGDFIQNPEEVHLVLNTPFSIFKTLGRKELDRKNYFEDNKELAQLYSPLTVPDSINKPMQKYNVVVFILESFGKENIGALNKQLDKGTYQGYTPFIDSLLEHSLVFHNSFANGRKSIDILPSLLSSIPSIKEPFVLTQFFDNKAYSLPSILREEGYHTSFFHGAANGSMGFSAYLKMIETQYYFGKTEYETDANTQKENSTNLWGIWDELFFNYFAKQINTFREPFFTSIFSLSSHHPFDLPEKYNGRFAEGVHPIHRTIRYTDFALKKFFAYARQQDWFKNTIFVFTADHCQSQPTHDEYKTSANYFSVPIVFYSPVEQLALTGESDKLIQQIDIMPSLLGLMNYNKSYSCFGKNVFDKSNNNHFLVNYINGLYQAYMDDYILLFDGKTTVGLYNRKNDVLQKNNLKDQEKEVRLKMERQLKAFIQQYHNRMIDNKLIVY